MPRRIILLSDGTGNSSAKVWRTNVWRMFSALDLTGDEQIACYDDGVGSSSFKPLALLGGAFGVGLRRNVISLYKFACRNFRATGDEVYGFGFSRGAFTIRVTIGLIIDQGLIPAAAISDTELDKLARRAYREYHKKHFHTNWWLIYTQILRWLGRNPSQSSSSPPAGRNIPIIRFLGLWDTVAAYGLPVEEMTRGVSQWIWPLEIPSHTLHGSIQRACQALSLDDERTTFHPVLWDESKENPQTGTPRFTKGERISQVWFAGVHANVGGGYPDDSLAQIPLYWIIQEARECGLKFKAANPEAIAEIKEAQDKDGRLYDSRSGLASYYRYGPRRLSRLCNEVFSRTMDDAVLIKAPKIHDSVFKRIKNNAHVYAPIGIPHDYELIVTVSRPNSPDADFRIDSLPANAPPFTSDVYEWSKDAQARVLGERDTIWPLVYLRALLYFATLVATIFFVIFPLTANGNDLSERENTLKWLSDLIRTVGGFLPSWASSWFDSYAEYPKTFLVLAVIIGLLIFGGYKTAAAIGDGMTALWRESLAHLHPAPARVPTNVLSSKDQLLRNLRSMWRDYLGPALSAVVIVYFVLSIANKWAFTALDEAGLVCARTPGTEIKNIPENGVFLSFNISSPCFATGYKLDRLGRYLIWTSPTEEEVTRRYGEPKKARSACSVAPGKALYNGSVKTDARGYATFHNPEGRQLTLWETVWSALLLPLKRHYGQPWFRPVARYGSIGNELDFLEPDPDPHFTTISEHVVPRVPGELFFYFNDAVIAIPSLQTFYEDNKGCATFFVRPAK
jgi:uncharacterized protein (DUF2235 family)